MRADGVPAIYDVCNVCWMLLNHARRWGPSKLCFFEFILRAAQLCAPMGFQQLACRRRSSQEFRNLFWTLLNYARRWGSSNLRPTGYFSKNVSKQFLRFKFSAGCFSTMRANGVSAVCNVRNGCWVSVFNVLFVTSDFRKVKWCCSTMRADGVPAMYHACNVYWMLLNHWRQWYFSNFGLSGDVHNICLMLLKHARQWCFINLGLPGDVGNVCQMHLNHWRQWHFSNFGLTGHVHNS